ncbi:MAG: GDP-mannose 4,6-dehydratase [Bryobacteraceae bacterium]|nr:GDP-mannose 4,6-dehydratase [Bryobacteraceae bacterium]
MTAGSGKVLVTGAGGFIGSHLAEALVREGRRVRAFIHYNSAGRRGWLEASPLASDIEFFSGDVRDFDSVYRAMEGCGEVFHLAALIGIPYSYLTPQAYLRTNVDGAYHVLESARLRGAENVVLTSTSEVYGTARQCPMSESHPVNSQSPYAATKAAADQFASSYHRSFSVPVTIARPFNTYGPRQSERALIPAVIAQALSPAAAVRIGNAHPTRDFTFVEDVVRGFLAVASGGFTGEAVHIGSGVETSVSHLVSLVARLTGAGVKVVGDDERRRPESSEVDRLLCDSGKLRARTGWAPRIGLEEGLRRTIAWMRPRLAELRPEEYRV